MAIEKKWYPGHIEKAKRVIKENLKAVQAVIEMTDARIPYSGRAYEWKSLFHNKKNVILLSKADLADPNTTKEWISYYENQGIPCFSLNLKGNPAGIKNLFASKMMEISKQHGFQRYMIVGIPNVGKSTLVNMILGRKKVKVANTPGVTRGLQWVNISDSLMLMDTPGILYRQLFSVHVLYKLLLCGCIKGTENDISDALEYAFSWIIDTYPQYSPIKGEVTIERPFEFEKFLEETGHRRGYLQKENRIDRTKVLNYLLSFFQKGEIGKITFETPELLNTETK
jgi:ribosome biogenesis GTPase A